MKSSKWPNSRPKWPGSRRTWRKSTSKWPNSRVSVKRKWRKCKRTWNGKSRAREKKPNGRPGNWIEPCSSSNRIRKSRSPATCPFGVVNSAAALKSGSRYFASSIKSWNGKWRGSIARSRSSSRTRTNRNRSRNWNRRTRTCSNWAKFRPRNLRLTSQNRNAPTARTPPARTTRQLENSATAIGWRRSGSMNATATKLNAEGIVPAVHLEFIQNQLENATDSGPQEIEQYHRSLFLHHHAVEWETHRQETKIHEERLSFLEGQLKNTDASLSERKSLVAVTIDGKEDTKPTSPWNAWDMLMFGACCLGIVCLITFGVWNISFNLLESGLITFRDNPLRSYLWAALLPVGALAVKIGWDSIQDRKRRDVYLWTCLLLGMLGVLVWAGAYACVYPTLSKGIGEHIASLTVFDNQSPSSAPVFGLNFAGAKWIDVITVASQAIAEIFLSAVMGMYLTNLYARHRPVRLAEDPAFVQLTRERRDLEERIARERLSLGEAAGHLLRLDNQLAALVAYGKSIFHREDRS